MSTVTVIGGDPTASAPGADYGQMHARFTVWKIQALLSDLTRHLEVLASDAPSELLATLEQLQDTAVVAVEHADRLSDDLRGEGRGPRPPVPWSET